MLLIVLGLALLVATQLYIIITMCAGNRRQLKTTHAHIRALYVAESALARIVSRLRSAPWSERWFADRAAVEERQQLAGGWYSSYVATATVGGQVADVWIEGHFEDSAATTFWRVERQDDSLDLTTRMVPRFFTFLPPTVELRPGQVPPAANRLVEDMISARTRNHADTAARLRETDRLPDLPSLMKGLGVPLPAPVEELRRGAGGPPAGTRPGYGAYDESVDGPAPPAPPLPSTLVAIMDSDAAAVRAQQETSAALEASAPPSDVQQQGQQQGQGQQGPNGAGP